MASTRRKNYLKSDPVEQKSTIRKSASTGKNLANGTHRKVAMRQSADTDIIEDHIPLLPSPPKSTRKSAKVTRFHMEQDQEHSDEEITVIKRTRAIRTIATAPVRTRKVSVLKPSNDEDFTICPVCDSECRCNNQQRQNRLAKGGRSNDGTSVRGRQISLRKLPEKRPRSPNVSSDEDIEEPAVKGTRSSTRPKKPIIIIEPEISTDSAISSDSDARDTDPEELEILEAEEAEIRELGVNSDEESNAEVSDSKNSIILRANSGGTIPPIDDPNEIDHVWSSDDYDHDKKPEEEEDPQHQLRLLSTALANLSDTSTTTGGRRASKRKVASSAAGEGKSTPRHKRPSHERAVIPPAVIQTYLASRGIQVSLQHASRLSAGLASGSFLSPHLEQTFLHDLKKMMASSEDRKPLLTSRNSQIDPKFMSKEVKQREALQAQAMNTNSRTANPATQLFIPPTLIPVNENSREDEMLPLDAVIEMSDSGNEEDDEAGEFEEGSEPSIAAKEMPLLTTRWDRIPIGTFRRSRKISAPILKLSEAVKSNFGVVPQTIHETIFTADASDLEKLAEEDLENIYHSTKTLMRGKSEAAPRHLHLHAGAAHDCSCCYCECDECEDERAHGEEQQAVVFSSGYSSSVSSEMGTDSRSKPSKRRDSITVADLSILIHDPSNPPSTCTSPSAFRLSPTMGSIHMVDHIAMEDLHLEPATFSFPLRVPRLAVERLPETQQRSNNASATNSRRTKRRSRKISFGGTFDTILESCL